MQIKSTVVHDSCISIQYLTCCSAIQRGTTATKDYLQVESTLLSLVVQLFVFFECLCTFFDTWESQPCLLNTKKINTILLRTTGLIFGKRSSPLCKSEVAQKFLSILARKLHQLFLLYLPPLFSRTHPCMKQPVPNTARHVQAITLQRIHANMQFC